MTSRTTPLSTCAPGSDCSVSSRMRIFSGRTVTCLPSRSIRLETPMNPATKSLAAGELRRLAVAKATEPHRGQDLRDPLMPLRPRHPLDAQLLFYVVGHRHVREQGIR